MASDLLRIKKYPGQMHSCIVRDILKLEAGQKETRNAIAELTGVWKECVLELLWKIKAEKNMGE